MRDCDIRPVLKSRLARQFAKAPTLLVDELGFNEHCARVDIAVINCALHAYEIKSERDTLARLPEQLGHYADQFHFVTVVAATKHLAGVLQMSDPRVGVVEARKTKGGTIQLVAIRRPKRMSQSVERIVRLFWWEEAVAALERNGLGRGLRKHRATVLREMLTTHLTAPQLLAELRAAICERRAQQLAVKQASSDGLSRWL